jgi:hypothetical protein
VSEDRSFSRAFFFVLGLILGAALFVLLSAGSSGASSGGASSGLTCTTTVSGSAVSVNVTGMRTDTHLFYEVQLGGQSVLGPYPPRSAYSFAFTVPPGTYSATVLIGKAEGYKPGGPGNWTFIGWTTVPNLCSAVVS